MKTIFLDNWKTSLLGLALIAAGLYTGLMAKQSWTESGPIVLSGAGLIFSKDAKRSPEQVLQNELHKNISND